MPQLNSDTDFQHECAFPLVCSKLNWTRRRNHTKKATRCQVEQDPWRTGNKEIVNENSRFLKDDWIAAALLPRVLPITFTFNLIFLKCFMAALWKAYYDVPGTLILPIKGWDVILFYSWVKNRRQGWPRCQLSPAAGCYFEPWSYGSSEGHSMYYIHMQHDKFRR